jgi:hypothetical protein
MLKTPGRISEQMYNCQNELGYGYSFPFCITKKFKIISKYVPNMN